MTNSLTDENYQQQFQHKIKTLTKLMAEFNPPAVQAFTSPIKHYRMRAEFRIWHDGDHICHIMFDQLTRRRIEVTQFPIASQLINQAMIALLAAIKHNHPLRYKLFQVDYLSTLSQQLIITLLYHKQLDEAWELEARNLKDQLTAQGFNVQIIGRAKKHQINLDNDYIDEVLSVDGHNIIYRQVENSFTQPNARVNIQMLEWAIEATKNATGDLLELYCGNGNFSLALAKNFRQVLATEIAKPSVSAAQYNIQVNDIDNVKILRMSAEDFTEALKGEREFNRLKGIDLTSYECNTVLVDPPRAGLDDKTLTMIQKYPTIIYISCNPLTLKDNLAVLTETHDIVKLAMFDQFPYTEHMESGVVLAKKKN
ncbi:tRNA (uridine(54)-C5)-methyltransferase TrmA [Zophobihabitans entericus]|uniref:tRNA/tmRNA (uracil-C(5))-methyltransferase n=1 Tax=Zophobihabitans entericus TaxID=1635327 RepID=A0A6G9IB87_9GAMM|nr:tRNA (uridine(54)-C5)-methyltransferase TrmA [Zophobihabitans entericus]QIQ21491.1 tRNA (uridine(54)-C5)-methyltransferase TrmA [Zophobihabitans entericus]